MKLLQLLQLQVGEPQLQLDDTLLNRVWVTDLPAENPAEPPAPPAEP